MTIPALPALNRASPTFRSDLDDYFLTKLPATTGAINDAILEIDADVGAAADSATAAAAGADTATTKAAEAVISASASLASANSAVLSPGTSATSATSLTIGEGAKTLTIQAGKAFALGQTVIIASTADATKQMSGILTAHDSATGAITVHVATGAFSGSGTFAAWTISLTAAVVATPVIISAAADIATPIAVSAATDLAFILSIALS